MTAPQELQLAALEGLINAFYSNKRIMNPLLRNKIFHRKITRKIYNLYTQVKSLIIKTYCCAALAAIDNQGKRIWHIIRDSQTPLIFRLSGVFGLLATAGPNIMTIFNLIKKTPQSASDYELRQILLLATKWALHNLATTIDIRNKSYQPIISLIDRQLQDLLVIKLKSDDPRLKRAALAALLWSNDRKIIARVYPYLQAQDLQIRRIAVTTLAGLIVRHQPAKLPDFEKSVLSMSSSMRQAAAIGYYDTLFNDIAATFERYNKTDLRGRYEIYRSHFRQAVAIQKTQILKKWLLLLNSAIAMNPRVHYHYEAAYILHKLRQFTRARQHLHQAIQLTAQKQQTVVEDQSDKLYSTVDCRILLGEICRERGEYQEAQQIFAKIQLTSPFSAQVHFNLGKIFQQTGKRRQAEQCFWNAYLCDTSKHEALFCLADILLQSGEIDKFLELNKYSTLARSFFYNSKQRKDFLGSQFVNHLFAHRYEKACKLLAQEIRKDPYQQAFYYYMGYALERLDDLPKARQYFCRAFLCSSRMEDVVYRALFPLAGNFIAQGHTASAIAILKYVHQKWPLQRSIVSDHAAFVLIDNHPWIRSLPYEVFNGIHRIMLKASGKALTAKVVGKNIRIQLWNESADDSQQWLIEHIGEGVHTIKSKSSGEFLCAENIDGDDKGLCLRRNYRRNTHKWYVEKLPDDVYLLKHKASYWVLNASIGEIYQDGCRVLLWRNHRGHNQKWTIQKQP